MVILFILCHHLIYKYKDKDKEYRGIGKTPTKQQRNKIDKTLIMYKSFQARLYEEISRILPSDDPSASPSYDDIMEFEYLDMVINETLRQCPAAPFGVTSRIASRDCTMPNILGKLIFFICAKARFNEAVFVGRLFGCLVGWLFWNAFVR